MQTGTQLECEMDDQNTQHNNTLSNVSRMHYTKTQPEWERDYKNAL